MAGGLNIPGLGGCFRCVSVTVWIIKFPGAVHLVERSSHLETKAEKLNSH